MRKGLILLISLCFFTASPLASAQSIKMNLQPAGVSEKDPRREVEIPLEQWNKNNEQIRQNFTTLTTVPFTNNHGVEFDFGPAQFMITVPFN